MKILKTLSVALIAVTLNANAFAQSETGEGPPGYIYVTGWYKDTGVLGDYGRAVGPVLREYGAEGSFLGLEGRNMRVLEGTWVPGRIMLIKFPSGDHVNRFWWSDDYQEVAKIREPVSAVDISQVDGVPGVTPLMTDEAAYLVFLSKIEDIKTIREQYSAPARALIEKYGGQFIVIASRPNAVLLEGSLPNATVVFVEFPNVEAMRNFWNDPEYRRLSEIRKGTGKWSVAEVVPAP